MHPVTLGIPGLLPLCPTSEKAALIAGSSAGSGNLMNSLAMPAKSFTHLWIALQVAGGEILSDSPKS